MNINKSRWLVILFSFLTLFIAAFIRNSILSIILMAVCLLFALFILYRHMEELTELSEDNPKMRTLKSVTIFDGAILFLCVLLVISLETNFIRLSEDNEKYLAAMIVSAVILLIGNISPKLAFNKHTGLRLPWTVTDENTWIMAHRILGYISVPLAVVYIAGVIAVDCFESLTLIIILLWVGIPAVLSYVYYIKKIKGKF